MKRLMVILTVLWCALAAAANAADSEVRASASDAAVHDTQGVDLRLTTVAGEQLRHDDIHRDVMRLWMNAG